MNKLNTTFALAGLTFLLLFASCDKKNLNYKTYKDAKEAGLFEKGWIPEEVLNEEITDILFQSNLDFNTCIFSFNTIEKKYDFDLYDNLNNPKVSVQGINIPAKWSVGIVKCHKFAQVEDVIVALDTIKGILYGWRTNVEAVNTFDFENIITKNEGKYPNEIDLFENNDIAERIKKLTKGQFVEMVNNFNVQSPIVNEKSIYKLTGCKQHSCPSFFTTILFDARKDNIHIIIDRDGMIQDFYEKEKINLTTSLKLK